MRVKDLGFRLSKFRHKAVKILILKVALKVCLLKIVGSVRNRINVLGRLY